MAFEKISSYNSTNCTDFEVSAYVATYIYPDKHKPFMRIICVGIDT